MNAPGKTLLKVSGILLVIGAAFVIIMAITSLAGGALLASTGSPEAVAGAAVIVFGILSLLLGVFQLITGIAGIKNCAKPEKAKTCIILGIITVLLGATNLFSGEIVAGLIGLIIPALYLIGAFRNKNAA